MMMTKLLQSCSQQMVVCYPANMTLITCK